MVGHGVRGARSRSIRWSRPWSASCDGTVPLRRPLADLADVHQLDLSADMIPTVIRLVEHGILNPGYSS
jgi:hypothetical protein